jgi:hypothetical protein
MYICHKNDEIKRKMLLLNIHSMALVNLFRSSKFKLKNMAKKTHDLWIKTSNI